jgi:hypothetical protein
MAKKLRNHDALMRHLHPERFPAGDISGGRGAFKITKEGVVEFSGLEKTGRTRPSKPPEKST